MPITRGAKKAHRQSLRRQDFNLARKKTATDVVKSFKKLVASGDKKGAEALLPKVQQALDKASKTRALSAGTVARKKSRLAKLLKKG